MTFTEDRANVGVQLSDEPMFQTPDTAPFTAQIDPATGTITDGHLTVPDFDTHITDPDRDVTVSFDIGEITGSYDEETGALSLSGTAGGTLTSEGRSCTVATVPAVLTISTAGEASEDGSPRAGVPFAAGLGGDGSLAGGWTDMTAEPIDVADESFCSNVSGRIGGPGGVWLEQEDLVAPPAPQLTGTDPPSPGLSGAPRILGVAEAGSTVTLYSGSECAGVPLATASAAELGSPGIAVEVAESVTATFSATATDPGENTSDCSEPITYRRLESAPPTGKECHKAKRRMKLARHRVQVARRKVHRLHRRIERADTKRRKVRLRAGKRAWRDRVDRRREALRRARAEARRACR